MQEASRLGRGGQGLLELLLHLPQGLGVRGELAETQAQGLGEAGLLGMYSCPNILNLEIAVVLQTNHF